jgi:hypothetical protein
MAGAGTGSPLGHNPFAAFGTTRPGSFTLLRGANHHPRQHEAARRRELELFRRGLAELPTIDPLLLDAADQLADDEPDIFFGDDEL